MFRRVRQLDLPGSQALAASNPTSERFSCPARCFYSVAQTSCGLRYRDRLSEVPGHRQRLSREDVFNLLLVRLRPPCSQDGVAVNDSIERKPQQFLQRGRPAPLDRETNLQQRHLLPCCE